jgi:hypothetical protein
MVLMFSRASALGVGLFLLLACKEKAEEDARPAPTAPWAAQPPSSQAGTKSPSRVTYRVDTGSEIRVQLPAKEAKPSGVFRSMQGSLDVDLHDLTSTRGALVIDLASLVMEGNGAAAENDSTQRAKNWLNLGDSRSEAELTRARTARFTLTSITSASAPAAHQGRRIPLPEDSESTAIERRRVSLTALGQLEVNGLRTTREARLDVDFDYANAATGELRPLRISVRTTRPIPVPLAEHAIEPRDTQGRLVASDLALLGRVVGTTAQIEVHLLALP